MQKIDIFEKMRTEAEEACLEKIIAGTTPITYESPDDVPQIRSMEELARRLPAICEAIHKKLLSQNSEATYQGCLEMDLKKAGVLVLSEVEIPIFYGKNKVSTRRADLIVETPDGKCAVLELKALANPLDAENMHQLEYYMHAFGIMFGFLVNFRHNTGFPDVDPTSEMSRTYKLQDTELCGPPLNRHATRSKARKHADAPVQIIKAEYVPVAAAMPHADRQTPTPSASPAARQQRSPEETVLAVAQGTCALTQAGTPCKKCLDKGRLCHQHK